mgnify:FL=1
MQIQQVSVRNMESSRGNLVPNQFTIRVKSHDLNQVGFDMVYFQSYNSIIAVKESPKGQVTIDQNKWDYSVTTGKYRNQFLGEDKKTTAGKIKKRGI